MQRMKPNPPFLGAGAGIAVLAALAALASSARLDAAEATGPTAEELRKIASAVPAKANATPAKPRRLLVFTLCRGYVHASIPYGARAVELMGERTGAFKATISDDIAWFEPEKLKQFDGICLVSALGELFLPADFDKLSADKQAEARQTDTRLKRVLLEYLRSGGGLAGIHGASYAFYQWPEFGEALGGLFDSHPWNATEKIAIKIDEPSHPVVAVFQGVGFEIIDEGYQFKDPYSRSRSRVLYSLDPSRTDMNKQGLRADRDFGLCWVRRFGQGRVFYTALGHNSEEFWNPLLLRHILDGIQFSLGDLAAPAEPRP
jgi:type 1 glutamine amidotransferase